MNIDFYRTNDENIVINKTKTLLGTLTGTLKDSCSIKNPVFTINRPLNDSLITANYVNIPLFGRYYFIEDLVIDGQFYIYYCKCDVLESFYNDFKNIPQVITRHETQFNVNLQDDQLPLSSEKDFKIVPIGTTPFNVTDIDYNIVLNASNEGTQL